MKCSRCNKKMSEVNGLVPIDPKGTKDRRWVCLDCITDEEWEAIPSDVVDLSQSINPDFKKA